MPIKRSYAEFGDACATAHGMELLGDVWTYPILRELFLGPKRFGELASALLGITPAVLTGRLKMLEARGLLRRRDAPAPVRAQVYELTDWAAALEPVMHSLARWVHEEPGWHPVGGLTPDGIALAIRAMAPATLPGEGEIAVHIGDRRQTRGAEYVYALRWGSEGVGVERAETAAAQVRVDSTDLAEALFAGRELEDAAELADFIRSFRAAREQDEQERTDRGSLGVL